MLLNSISAINKYPPGPPVLNYAQDAGVGRSYVAGTNGAITISASKPSNLGRETSIVNYHILIKDSLGNVEQDVTESASTFEGNQPQIFTALDVTKTHIISISASNSTGYGTSLVTSPITATCVPQAAANSPTVSVLNTGSVSIAFTPWNATSSSPYTASAATPGTGNLAITGVTVILNNVTTATTVGSFNGYSISSPITLNYSFAKGNAYAVCLAANNADGQSAFSPFSANFNPNP